MLNFETGCKTDVGLKKAVNEDSVIIIDKPKFTLLAVADGVGSLGGGEKASQKTVGMINEWCNCLHLENENSLQDIMQNLDICVKEINKKIYSYALSDSVKMGTTLSLLILYENSFGIYHVGDSRVYRQNDKSEKRLEVLTEDHNITLPKEVNGVIQMRSYLSECLGYKDSFNAQMLIGEISEGDVFMLCTDGVYKLLSETEIAKTMQKHKKNLDKMCTSLIKCAKKKKEKDNLTAAVARVYR